MANRSSSSPCVRFHACFNITKRKTVKVLKMWMLRTFGILYRYRDFLQIFSVGWAGTGTGSNCTYLVPHWLISFVPMIGIGIREANYNSTWLKQIQSQETSKDLIGRTLVPVPGTRYRQTALNTSVMCIVSKKSEGQNNIIKEGTVPVCTVTGRMKKLIQ
jgi:hypothetical protein